MKFEAMLLNGAKRKGKKTFDFLECDKSKTIWILLLLHKNILWLNIYT